MYHRSAVSHPTAAMADSASRPAAGRRAVDQLDRAVPALAHGDSSCGRPGKSARRRRAERNRRRPPRPTAAGSTRTIVLVDDQRPHPFVEIVATTDPRHDPVLDPERLVEVNLRPAPSGARQAPGWSATCRASRRAPGRRRRTLPLPPHERGQDCVPTAEREAGSRPSASAVSADGGAGAANRAIVRVDVDVALERLGKPGESGARNEGVRKTECERIARVGAKPGQREIDARMTREARQKIRSAHVGEKADADLRHGESEPFSRDAMRGIDRDADAPTHDDAVDQRDDGLGIGPNPLD